jgi:hypothetical protein
MKIFILAGLLLGAAAGASAAEYRIRTVDFPGAANTALYAINDDAHCVGAERDRSGAHHAIVFAEGVLHILDPNGLVGRSAESWAFSINNRGDIAGAFVDSAGSHHGFVHRWDHSVEIIDYPGGFDSQAYGINDHDTIIGVYNDAGGNSHAFVRRAGAYSTIDLVGGLQTIPLSINDREEIVGEYITTPNTNGYGYVQKPDGSYSIFTAPGSDPQQTFFISINNRDQILGGYANATTLQQNFLATRSTYSLFNLPPRLGASLVSAETVNDSDEIVGFYFDAANVAHGFLAIPAKSEEEEE